MGSAALRVATSDGKPESWTAAAVSLRLAEAASALRRMPRVQLQGRMTCWPDVAQDSARYWMAYGTESARVRPALPSPQELDRMDEALGWLLLLSSADRKLVWARASGVTWRKLEDLDGRSERTLRGRCQSVHAALARALNGRQDRSRG